MRIGVAVHERRRWWSLPVDNIAASLASGGMPPTLFGFVRRVSGSSQAWLSLLAIFALNTAPLELQRRMLNAIVHVRDMKLVLGLAAAYVGIVLSEGLVKLLMVNSAKYAIFVDALTQLSGRERAQRSI